MELSLIRRGSAAPPSPKGRQKGMDYMNELELKYECNSRLLDARKLFETDRVRQSEKLNELDVFHDDVEDLFRS